MPIENTRQHWSWVLNWDKNKSENQSHRTGLFSFPEHSFSIPELQWLLSIQLLIDGSTTSTETPRRYRCVRFWHVLQRKHLICLRAKKLALWTHLSQFLHKKASSAWQYSDALALQSSQDMIEPVEASRKAASLGICGRQRPPNFPSSRPWHILRNSIWHGLEVGGKQPFIGT